MPLSSAASSTVRPFGTVISLPSIVILTVSISHSAYPFSSTPYHRGHGGRTEDTEEYFRKCLSRNIFLTLCSSSVSSVVKSRLLHEDHWSGVVAVGFDVFHDALHRDALLGD